MGATREGGEPSAIFDSLADAAEVEEAVDPAKGGDLFPDLFLEVTALGFGERAEEGLEFDGIVFPGYPLGEMAEDELGGDHGLDEPGEPAPHRLDDLMELYGKLVGVGDELGGDLLEFGRGEGLGVAAVLEVVEVVEGSASAAGAELGVAVRAAAGVVPHGPVAAVGDGAAAFVRGAGHGGNQQMGKSANGQIGNR